MHAFDYVRADSIDHAIALLAQPDGGDGRAQPRVLSGGTDLLIALREGRLSTDRVVDIKFVPELSALTYDPATGLDIGAAVPCYRICSQPDIAAAYPGLIDAVHLIGGVQIQGRASLGGNLCNASPAADSVPALIAHGATATIAGPQGMHTLPVADFCRGPGKTVLAPGEFLVSLHVPPPLPHSGAAYLRFIPRNEMDIAVVGVGVYVELDAEQSHFTVARIALGAVAATAILVADAGAALVGEAPGAAAIAQAAILAQAAARPISDMRGTAEFRRHLVGVLTRRALTQAIARVTANRGDLHGQ